MTTITIRCSTFTEHRGETTIAPGEIWQAGCGDCWLADELTGHWHGDNWVPETTACPFVGCDRARPR